MLPREVAHVHPEELPEERRGLVHKGDLRRNARGPELQRLLCEELVFERLGRGVGVDGGGAQGGDAGSVEAVLGLEVEDVAGDVVAGAGRENKVLGGGGGDAEIDVGGSEGERAAGVGGLEGELGEDLEEDLAGGGACHGDEPVDGTGLFHVVVRQSLLDAGFNVLYEVLFADGYTGVFEPDDRTLMAVFPELTVFNHF